MNSSIFQLKGAPGNHSGGAAVRKNARPYTGADITFLKVEYPAGDIDKIAARLGRGASSVRQIAARFGIRRTVPKRSRPEIYITTPEIDAEIQALYAQPHHHQGKRRALAEKVGWPAWKITRRAIALGLVTPRTKESPWNGEELQILAEFGHLSPPVLCRKLAAAGYQRTETGILVKRKRLRLTAPNSNAGWSGNRLAQFLGVDAHRIMAWHKKGWLRATIRETGRASRQGAGLKWFSRAEVRRFVVETIEVIDLAKVDKYWLLEVLTPGEIGAPAKTEDKP